MYRIALCDDELSELEKTEALLAGYKSTHTDCDFTTFRFTTVDALLDEVAQVNDFDMIILDIYLPGKTGIEGAQELREKGIRCPIIFQTTSLEHAVEAFSVDAVQYLIKPVEEARFFAVMGNVFSIMEDESRKYIALYLDRGMRRLALRDIICCESHGNYQYLTLTDGTESRVRMTLMELYTLMGDCPDFAFVGSAYLVNLSHVGSLSAKEILLDNGRRIGVPRGSYPSLKEQYFKFYCSRRESSRL